MSNTHNIVETVDIVRSLVSELNKTINIDSIVDNLDGTYTVETCDTYYLHECLKITIDAVTYTVKSVEKNVSFVIKGDVLPTATSFELPAPFYFHGTVIQTNQELINFDQFDKLPMAYLLEVLEDDFFNRDEINDRESDIRLFFLTTANFADWKTGDHYKSAIEPMRSVAYNFINVLNNSKLINIFATYTLINRVNFGVYTTDKGNTKNIFNDNMSGVELRLTLPIRKVLNCNNICN